MAITSCLAKKSLHISRTIGLLVTLVLNPDPLQHWGSEFKTDSSYANLFFTMHVCELIYFHLSQPYLLYGGACTVALA